MKTLELKEMEKVQGGNETVYGICTAASLAGALGWWTGVLAVVGTVAVIGCAGYAIYDRAVEEQQKI